MNFRVLAPSVFGGLFLTACTGENALHVSAAGPDAGQAEAAAQSVAPPVSLAGAGTEPVADPRLQRKLEAIRGLAFENGRVQILAADASTIVAGRDAVASEVARLEGLALLAQNDLIGAIRAEVKALLLAPDVADNYLALGQALVTQKGWESKAAAAYRSGLDLDEQSAVLWYHYGDALWRVGEVDQSVAAWLRSDALDPQSAQTAQRLAHVAYLRGEDAQAWQWVHKAEARGGRTAPQLRETLAARSPEPAH